MTQGIRFEPNAQRYNLDTLLEAFDPSFKEKLEKTVTIATDADRSKILENIALESKASALLGISPKRGQQAVELHSMATAQSILEASDKRQFESLPEDIRKACERAWDLAREATINY